MARLAITLSQAEDFAHAMDVVLVLDHRNRYSSRPRSHGEGSLFRYFATRTMENLFGGTCPGVRFRF